MRKQRFAVAVAAGLAVASCLYVLPARADETVAQVAQTSTVAEVTEVVEDVEEADTDEVTPDETAKDIEESKDATEKDKADSDEVEKVDEKTDASTEGKTETKADSKSDTMADAAPVSPAEPTNETDAAAAEPEAQADAAKATLTVQAHVQDIGWQTAVPAGKVAGTTGRGKRMEALKFALTGVSGSVQVQAHVSDQGWDSGWTDNQAGTTGKSRALEAVRIRLSGDVAEKYDIYYRVHAANMGWMGWAKNGDAAGTQGYGYSIEAIEVRLVAKGETGPTTGNAFKAKAATSINVIAGVFGRGWQAGVTAGKTAGTTGQSRALTGLAMNIDQASWVGGSVQYRVSTSLSGLSGWANAGTKLASSTSNAPIQTMQVKLTGDMAEKYDVYYRVHAANNGWMGWAKNGETAGSEKVANRAEAVQVVLVAKGGKAPGSTANAYEANTGVRLQGQAHVANQGWLGATSGTEVTLGTTGKSQQLEALACAVMGNGLDGSAVQVQAHVANIGWQNATTGVAGTTGRGYSVQAVKINLTGAAAQKYDVYYQVHVAGIGWLGWAKNGEQAGTTGFDRAVEAVRIRLVAKGQSGPSATAPASLSAPTVTYSSYIQNIGWQGQKSNGGFSGTTGQSLRVEALKASVSSNLSGSIGYQVHVQDIGWQSSVSNGAVAGTTGQSRRVEAVKFWLSGQLAEYYDIWYRVYAQDYGWMGWTCNGAAAGTSSVGLRVEGVQVCLRLKGSPAPGSTANSYTNKPKVPPMSSDQVRMYYMAQNYASNTDWLIMVDTSLNRIGIFRGSKGNWSWSRFWLCSTGKPLTPTVLGEYKVYGKGYSFGSGFTCYYYTQFYGDYLIHSVTYYQNTFNVMDGRLGMNLSHGCVRLDINNAKWVYDNVPYNTKVVIYN